MSFRMPAEWEPHARTLIGWPCRVSSWRDTLAQGPTEFASVCNALVDFEPVTLICASDADAADARRQVSERVDIVVRPMDGSWLRDNGPIFVSDGASLEALHFRFNAWGERHSDRDRDARLGATLAGDLGVPVRAVDVVLEGGAVTVDGAGTMIAPEGCVMHPTRNWFTDRDTVEARIKDALGLDRLIWLPEGLAEDQSRDPERMYYGTDGHADLFMCFIATNRVLMLAVPEGDPNFDTLQRSREILERAGIEVVDFPYLSGFEAGGHYYIAPYMNFYIANGVVLMPQAGVDPEQDAAARDAIDKHFPDREVIAITMRAGPMQGGAIHCLTQQVPSVG